MKRRHTPFVETLDSRVVPSTLGHAPVFTSAHVIPAGAPSPGFPPGFYTSTAGEFRSLLHPAHPLNTTPTLSLSVDGNAKVTGQLSFVLATTRNGIPLQINFQSTSFSGRVGPTGLFTWVGSGPITQGVKGYFSLSGSLAASTLTGRYVFLGGSSLDVGTFTFTLSGGSSGSHVGRT
jgi:hypothetical protein